MDASGAEPEIGLWVFGYGSLIWHPDFPVLRQEIATLPDYHRSFCMRSIHHRGSETAPGLVLALDPCPGAACKGVAMAVAPGDVDATLSGLRERELISSAYREVRLSVDLSSGPRVEAVTYVVDRAHRQYCGALSLEDQAAIIAHAVGGRGTNRDYLERTAGHLSELGLADADLDWLVARVAQIAPQ